MMGFLGAAVAAQSGSFDDEDVWQSHGSMSITLTRTMGICNAIACMNFHVSVDECRPLPSPRRPKNHL